MEKVCKVNKLQSKKLKLFQNELNREGDTGNIHFFLLSQHGFGNRPEPCSLNLPGMSESVVVKVCYGLVSEKVNVASTWHERGSCYPKNLTDKPIGNLINVG